MHTHRKLRSMSAEAGSTEARALNIHGFEGELSGVVAKYCRPVILETWSGKLKPHCHP